MKMIKTLVFGAALAALASNASAQSWLTNGLVAYYPFNGNANDNSGNRNDGIVVGAVLINDRFGQTNNAYLLNGITDYIKILDAPANDLPSQFSASFWVKPSPGYGTPAQGACQIISKWGGGGVGLASYNIGVYSAGQLYVATSDGKTTTVAADTSVTTTSVWHQVVLVRDETTFRLFRDNKLLFSTNSLVQPQQNSVYNLNFGREEYGNYAHYGGGLDDVRIYNRALSSAEVAQLYAIESGPRVDLIKAVKPAFSYLWVGTNYQLQLSADLNTWTNHGSPFTATNTSMVYPQYWDVDGWGSLFFRLQSAP